jgi:hypothetical protein
VAQALNPILAMKAADGALPTLRAATDPAAGNGSFAAPSRFFEMNGPPVFVGLARIGRDAAVASRLWDVSEALTGVRYDVAGAPAYDRKHA